MPEFLTVIVPDIFGKSEALHRLADNLPGKKHILDPYEGKVVSFSDELEAYAVFIKQMGHDRYEQLLRYELEDINGPFQLLGFSAGATACWRAVCGDKPSAARQIICIYGSQIRHHCHLRPTVPTTVLLPVRENTFDIKEHAEILGKIPRVSLKKTPYLHGFINELSPNFDKHGYSETLSWLQTKL